MTRGEYKLAVQSGSKGYYGIVALHVEPDTDSGKLQVEFDPKLAQDWQVGARFGIEYVMERIPSRFPNGVRIKVDLIRGQPVDTNNVVIAYVSAHALLAALELENVRKPDLDPVKSLFLFPNNFALHQGTEGPRLPG